MAWIPCPRRPRMSPQDFAISREDQDLFALRSQQAPRRRRPPGFFAARDLGGRASRQARATTITVDRDEHPRAETTLDMLAKLKTPFRKGGSVTAGNASGVNDGAGALLIASRGGGQALWPDAARAHRLDGRAGVRAAHHGHGPRARDARNCWPGPGCARRHRRDRAQRGLCGAGAGGVARARPSRRCAACEPAWRRDRARPSAGHVRARASP